MNERTLISLLSLSLLFTACSREEALQKAVGAHMRQHNGTIVFIDAATGREVSYNRKMGQERTTPCSSFKIWNTLIGLETGRIVSENGLFYR